MLAHCRPGRRCKDWRDCPDCARIRQAQIAEVAERGAAFSPRVTYAVARTYDPGSFGVDKEAFIARLSKITEGGIWTVETGAISTGLHINIIAGTLDGLTAASLAKAWPATSAADFWAADIPRRDVRNVAAYVSKRDSFPHPDEYGGRLYGSWGAWKRPLAALVEDRNGIAPVTTGAALEAMLTSAGIPDPAPMPPAFVAPATEGPGYGHESRQAKAERMARNARAWEKAKAQHEADKARAARENYLRRVFALHRGEIELYGHCYIQGYGIATMEDARKLGLAWRD